MFNPINVQLNPICHLPALLRAHHILHISGIGVNNKIIIKINYFLITSFWKLIKSCTGASKKIDGI